MLADKLYSNWDASGNETIACIVWSECSFTKSSRSTTVTMRADFFLLAAEPCLHGDRSLVVQHWSPRRDAESSRTMYT
jgi:hypothetical protein